MLILVPGAMRVLIVFCHPVETSFAHAILRRVKDTLVRSSHEIRVRDLYGEGFDPVLSRQERIDYHMAGRNTVNVGDHMTDLKWAEALVVVFPTWWYGMPAMLKGWFDRVWVPHETFLMPEGNGPIRPGLTNLRHVIGITTCGSPQWWMWIMENPARRVLLRGLRAICHPRCKTLWLALYKMDSASTQDRERFLVQVEQRLARRLG